MTNQLPLLPVHPLPDIPGKRHGQTDRHRAVTNRSGETWHKVPLLALGEGKRTSGGQAIGSLGPLQVLGTHQTACGRGDSQRVLEMELWEKWSVLGVGPALHPCGDLNPHSVSITWVSSARGKTSSISRSGRVQWGCWGFWDMLAFWSTCGESWGTVYFLGSISSLSIGPQPVLAPGLTVQAVFQENLLCLKDRGGEVLEG